jgi:zinc-ribbon domain
MEHQCHKCGEPVEDGIPFCAHCGAPQIRVTIEPASASEPAGDKSLATPLILQSSQATALISVPTRWSQTLRPCALAAVIAIGLATLNLNPFVLIFGAGALAVPLSRRFNSATIITAGAGARLGAVTGVLCFGMLVALWAVVVAVSHKGEEFRNTLLEGIQQAAARTTDPQALAVFAYLRTPAGLAVMMLFTAVVLFFTSIALASLGGALSGALFGRRNRS